MKTFIKSEKALEKAVYKELVDWSSDVLSKVSPHFNNLPPCPYAKKAWKDNKVGLIFNYQKGKETFYKTVSNYTDDFDLTIVIDFKFEEDPDDFHLFLDEMNDRISDGEFSDKDIWVMGFHPYDEESEFLEEVDFDPHTETEYSMTFVQRLTKLQEAAKKLEQIGYYESYDDEYDAREIYAKRERLHRRLKDGNETT